MQERFKINAERPEPEPELQIIEQVPKVKRTPDAVVNIGDAELDEDHLPGSEPLSDKEDPTLPRLNS